MFKQVCSSLKLDPPIYYQVPQLRVFSDSVPYSQCLFFGCDTNLMHIAQVDIHSSSSTQLRFQVVCMYVDMYVYGSSSCESNPRVHRGCSTYSAHCWYVFNAHAQPPFDRVPVWLLAQQLFYSKGRLTENICFFFFFLVFTYATKAPRLATVGKNTDNFTIMLDLITVLLRQVLKMPWSPNCSMMCVYQGLLVQPNDGDDGAEAAVHSTVVGVVSDRTERHSLGEAFEELLPLQYQPTCRHKLIYGSVYMVMGYIC